MGADASIYSLVGRPAAQIESPIEGYTKLAQLRNMQDQNELAGLQRTKLTRDLQEEDAFKSGLSANDYNTPEGMTRLIGISPTRGIQLQKTLLENKKATGDIAHTAAQTSQITADQVAGQLAALTKDPSDQGVQSMTELMTSHGVAPQIVDGLRTRLMALPPELRAPWATAQAASQKSGQEALKILFPTAHMQDAGGTVVPVSTSTLPGQVAPGSAVPGGVPLTKTVTPGEVLSDTRVREEGDKNRGVTTRGQNMVDARAREAQNAPQYMETDAGLVALPKRLPNGQQPVGTPVVGADGQPLGKPLKPLPPSVNDAVIGNAQTLYSLDKAINLANGKSVDSAKGDQAATGWKGYLPQAILNRIDPTGIDTRAEVADIGSLKIHDRSGAAVTVSESPRLMPFIPTATDDQPTVIKKLTRLKEEAARMQGALTGTYSKEQGYKPSPVSSKGVKAADASPAAAAPKPAGRIVPAAGTVQDGYRFKGGNPADKANWEPA